MSADTPPLDATARAALRAKAEAARDARLAAEKYVAEVPDEMFSPAEHDRLVQQEYATDEAFRDACNDDVILALLAAVERGAEDTEKLRAENVNLWQIIRQKDRETYAAANSLDVAELDAMCCNLAIENAELREQVKRASHAATFMVE